MSAIFVEMLWQAEDYSQHHSACLTIYTDVAVVLVLSRISALKKGYNLGLHPTFFAHSFLFEDFLAQSSEYICCFFPTLLKHLSWEDVCTKN